VQGYDPANQRAAAGMAQIEVDRRHRTVVARPTSWRKAGKLREAQDLLAARCSTRTRRNREARACSAPSTTSWLKP